MEENINPLVYFAAFLIFVIIAIIVWNVIYNPQASLGWAKGLYDFLRKIGI